MRGAGQLSNESYDVTNTRTETYMNHPPVAATTTLTSVAQRSAAAQLRGNMAHSRRSRHSAPTASRHQHLFTSQQWRNQFIFHLSFCFQSCTSSTLHNHTIHRMIGRAVREGGEREALLSRPAHEARVCLSCRRAADTASCAIAAAVATCA